MYLDNEVSIDQQANVEKKIFAGNGLKIEDVPSWIINANFSRNETDLIAKNDHNETIVFVDFFTNFQLSSIISKNGLLIKGSILSTLAGPLIKGQYVQAANQEILSIGEVSSIDGNVKVTRLDGAELNLSAGDPVFQGDTIETSENGAVGLIFLDKTTLSLSDGGRMVLDELVYDPATGNGSMTVDMIEGAFSFVSGEIAKTGPDAMKVTTPVATVGIRGTTVAGKAAIEGNENSFTLLQDSDGNVGQISISNEGETVLAQIGATTSVSSFTAPPPPPIILSAAQIQANYGTALNVLPPTPAVAPTPQAAPPPQEEPEQGVEDTQDDEDTEEDISDEEVSDTEDSDSETSDEENELNEEGTLEGEEALDEEGLAIEEESANLETDAEQLPGEESAPPLGPDGEPLPLEEEGATQLGTDGEPVPSSEESVAPQLGPDGEPLSAEQETAGREAFEQALADGASPEEAMAAAAAAAGFEEPTPQGGPGDLGPAEVGDIGGGH